jgi:hypothetical protein
VFDYLCDPRIYGTAINDIRPQGISRNPANFVSKGYQDDFDRNKNFYHPITTTSTFEYRNGVPIIRIQAPFPKQELIIDTLSATTGWVTGGSLSNLVQDTAVFYKYPASLRFLLTGASTGTLTKTLANPLDLSVYEDVGVVFMAIEIPAGTTATDLTNIKLKIGSDSSNYDSITSTTGFLGSWVSNNWLLVAFDFSVAIGTGTPDWTKINYVQVSLTHSATIINFRIDDLFISFPTPAQILYQSAAIFLASGLTSATTVITLDTDTITLADPAYNIYLFESALAILQNTGASASDATSIKINSILHGVRARNGIMVEAGLYDLFKGDNPSQELRTCGSYYDNDTGYGGYYGNNRGRY